MQKESGLRISRMFTQAGESPYAAFRYEKRDSVIRSPDGSAVFEMPEVEVPTHWSQMATDILAQKYFRRTGVPQPDGSLGAETSVKQTVHRLADCWRHWGNAHGYFASETDAQVFYDEAVWMMLAQMAAPNSPQWFNTGLHHVYGIKGPAQGHYCVEPTTGEVREADSAYRRPQPHACFILSVEDDLVNPGGIMDLWVREARIFKYGSGSGTNFSNLRAAGEPLSGGGQSSGLLSFLKIGDRAAGAIKSGGTTRRAAKMVILEADHPEIEAFIQWKVEEERKVAALMAAGYPADYEGEAYRTVSGQNANLSVRVDERFLKAVETDATWNLLERSTGKISKTVNARMLWDTLAQAAWRCADPGLQFHTTINDWHTCPADGPIRASNPCSEYMFLDNTACNLASLNLRKFLDEETLMFDVPAYEHAIRIWTIVLEISVLMAQYPTKEIAIRSHRFRTLGLGYANLGALLMVAGLPYDSPKARAITGALTAILTAKAYETSAELAENQGPFEGYAQNREAMLRVIRNHRYAAYDASSAYEDLSVLPKGISSNECPHYLSQAACDAWDRALQRGEQSGFRNAQVSVLAPTGTIGLLMDCDTTGIEPEFALVKFKKLSGGGCFKIANQSVANALTHLGYTPLQIADIEAHMLGRGTFEGAPFINPESLKAKGFADTEIAALGAQCKTAFHILRIFTPHVLGFGLFEKSSISKEELQNPGFNLLKTLGFTQDQIEEANAYVCGTMMIEGAPHIRPEHIAVFDCANRNGLNGKRFIHAHGHLLMMAAAQPFISGAISKTINLPREASWEAIRECHDLAWKWGLKAISIYRDGSKHSQPLSNLVAETDSDVPMITAGDPRAPDEPLVDLRNALLLGQMSPHFQRSLQAAAKRDLPQKRLGFTQKAIIEGQALFVHTGEYDDGTLGEIFIDVPKVSSTTRSLLNNFAIAVSMGLQHGVPLTEFVDKFAFTHFEPAGHVEGHEPIKQTTSIIDFVFRLLAFEYLGQTDMVQIPPKPESGQKPERGENETREFNSAVPVPANYAGTKHHQPLYEASPQNHNAQMMGDAPSCGVCGHVTVRNGTCYKCLNCGTSTGCS